jgi:hypothetical protein
VIIGALALAIVIVKAEASVALKKLVPSPMVTLSEQARVPEVAVSIPPKESKEHPGEEFKE